MLFIGAATTGLIGTIGVLIIGDHVRREEQQRVNYNLKLVRSHYDQRLRFVAHLIEDAAKALPLSDETKLQASVGRIQEEADLTVLNVCDTAGLPLAGSYPDFSFRVPIDDDPCLRRALAGQPSWGTELLDAQRLQHEGGVAMAQSLVVRRQQGGAEKDESSSLFWWAACPVRDTGGEVIAIVYGGRALNHNLSLVDELRELAFGTDTYNAKPLGTVTIFQDGLRVATNVLGPGGDRAIGTTVSAEVQDQVLGQGKVWQHRAWVVDAWYLSSYEPIRNPEKEPIGMLYVGLLESPFKDLRYGWMKKLVILVLIISTLAVGITVLIVKRITAPLEELGEAAAGMTQGNHVAQFSDRKSYAEIARLTKAFQQMQRGIAERDQHLRQQNTELAEANEKLARVNRNYMESLGFVTHELKSPLAAMQNLIDVVYKGYAGEIPEKACSFLRRVRRSCSEMQGMVKNYLDLSRAERGELTPNQAEIELIADVVGPAVDQTHALFDLRNISLTVEGPDRVDMVADPEMLRIALINFLSNASKYGREGGWATVSVSRDGDSVNVTVRNDGNGFTAAEQDALFTKFSRLKNENTRGQRGSGLGLFLCRRIAETHGGCVRAESAPGKWAAFSISIPAAGAN